MSFIWMNVDQNLTDSRDAVVPLTGSHVVRKEKF
jgi:hypothetical protein